MSIKTIGIGIIGCGNIAGPYAQDLPNYSHVKLVGVADVEPTRAAALAAEHNCRAYSTVDELLADPSIDLVINLTIHHAHYDVTTRCFQADKHVYSEKPLATTYAEAQALVELAQRRGLRLGCSPFTFLGEAQQTAGKIIREGRLGDIRLAYAEVNWGRIETWHPNPAPFYDVGALWDVGVYPLTLLTAFLGPAKRVWSYGALLFPDRVTKDGTPFHITTPDFAITMLELASGVRVRLTTNFYVRSTQQSPGIELHGDLGSLSLTSWLGLDSWVGFAKFGEPFEQEPLVREAPSQIPWGRGVAEMAQAMLEDRPQRVTGEHAAHIVEILAAASESMRSGQPVEVMSTFPLPRPMEWAE